MAFASELEADVYSRQYQNIVVIIANEDNRTVDMNAFYFLLCGKIAEEEGIHTDVCHLQLKLLFLKVENDKTVLKNPEEIDTSNWGQNLHEIYNGIPESKNLSKKDFPEYWRLCVDFANTEFNMNLPYEPKNMSKAQFESYLKETIIR